MLSKRLKEAKPVRRGCVTCNWLLTLNKEDAESFEEWLVDKHSRNQLYAICVTDPDNPLNVSISAFKAHFKRCEK
jgi:hypothetical protein